MSDLSDYLTREWHQSGQASTGHPRTQCSVDGCGQEPIPYPWDRPRGAPVIALSEEDEHSIRLPWNKWDPYPANGDLLILVATRAFRVVNSVRWTMVSDRVARAMYHPGLTAPHLIPEDAPHYTWGVLALIASPR